MSGSILSLLLIWAFGLFSGSSDCFAFQQTRPHGPCRVNGSYSSELTSTNSYLENLSNTKPLAIPPKPAESPSPTSAITSTSTGEFQYVPILCLDQADAIADKAIACCIRNGFNPVAVYVLDAGGSPLVSKRMDGCSPVGIPEFAKAKAYSCIVNKYPSRTFRDRYTSEEAAAKFCQMTAMVAVSGNAMAPFPGGILLKVSDTIVGAVGVSGAAGDEDEYCAIRGVVEANLGISTVPENPSCNTVKDEM